MVAVVVTTGGCESESRWDDAATEAADAVPTAGPDGDGSPIHSTGGSASTLGKARDSAVRTRDRIQQRDSEIGDLADTIFDQ